MRVGVPACMYVFACAWGGGEEEEEEKGMTPICGCANGSVLQAER